ncbi:integrase domain-containing protein [Enterovibrio norvegicus]|uniref:integrase domain-containing protein n=1 Tax=Enterovibrio norvegicus TaxID=188144 RepID=UPI003D6971DC
MTIGQYPTITLAQARTKREDFNSLLSQDIDPLEYRYEQQRKGVEEAENTLKSIAEKWIEVKASEVSKDYANDIWRSLELHIFPIIGNMPVTRIKATHAISAIKPIAAKGNLETVKRVYQRINEVMYYAVNTGMIEANPLAKISAAFACPKKKNMPSIKPEELPTFMRALSRASISHITRCMIEWQLHTITRPTETAGARWEEIDWDEKLWKIPASRMKGKESKKREHQIPLTLQTLNLLSELKEISGHREFIFPGDRNPNTHANSQTANQAIKRMGYGGILVSHGLRSIASTTLNEQGFDPFVIESALAHVDPNEVRRAYNRATYLEKRRELMTWWSQHIDKALYSPRH